MSIIYRTATATEDQIFLHLLDIDNDFNPPLSKRVGLKDFAKKIHAHTVTFEAWSGGMLVGMVSAYFNRPPKSFINHVDVSHNYKKKGIATKLVGMCIQHAKDTKFGSIELEVSSRNKTALSLYEKVDFKPTEKTEQKTMLRLDLPLRDYNNELKDTSDHKYAYNFDFDVMHNYMVKSFEPFFVFEEDEPSNALELGSFKGDFTEKIATRFSQLTCVEASDEAIAIAKQNPKLVCVNFVNSMFETAKLDRKYDNIILTHVLEHLDDPVAVLTKIRNEWLSPYGRLFVACPNANAASRQIAVAMGLIPNNSSITPSEKDHGHNITYALDTLERDTKAAGLKTIHRGGIFFKALANFQWDRLLQTDIISKEYLDGCYQLGQKYPDLCSSIFLVCEKGSNE